MEKIRKIFILFVLALIVFIGSPASTSAKEQTPSHNTLTSFSKVINDNKSKYSKYFIIDCIGWVDSKYYVFLILYNGDISFNTNKNTFNFTQNGYLYACVEDNASGSIFYKYENDGNEYYMGDFIHHDVRYSNGPYTLDGKSFPPALSGKTISEGADKVRVTALQVATITLTTVASSILLYRLLVVLLKKLRHFLV